MSPRPRRRRILGSALVMMLLVAFSIHSGSAAAKPAAKPTPRTAAASTTVPSGAGTATALTGYDIQSSAKVTETAAAVSSPGYAATGWYPTGARSTVIAALLANGKYADPFYSTNLKNIPAADFKVPWWYRSDFTVADTTQRTYLDFSGVISAADVYVNGTQVATKAQVAGAYPRHVVDVTGQVVKGANSVAFLIQPNVPTKNLTMGWIDWLQPPPDQNMGIVRDVLVRRNGSVALSGAHVSTSLAVPSLATADLTVKVDARNDSAAAVTATVAGTVTGNGATINLSQQVSLAAHETKTVTFTPAATPQLHLTGPHVWWPAGMGGQPLYALDVTATVAGTTSDAAHENFGIRDIKAPVNGSGGRAYSINGRPLLIKGGGWSPDLFLRWDTQYTTDRLKYALDLGLNTIRLEGHIEPDEFFDLADKFGLLTLPGWECCDKWEGQVNGSEPGDTWTSADYTVAKDSMTAEANRLRDHPSVISFLIGSDFAPNATIEKNYVDALKAADWQTPIVAAASANSAPITGASGMKMNGPYDWVPPNYWYSKQQGGAEGFDSEVSAGPDIPTLDTLNRMMSPSELATLWQNPSAAQYHRSPSSTFSDLKLFDNAMTARYGAPTSLNDYVRKAQLAQYEATRAQYEAFGRNFSDSSDPATGVIYWMFNSGWTSLHWQLFDRYLDQGGAYYGVKQAGQPVHIQYSYDNRSVVVVNSKHGTASNLTARVTLFNTDGTQKFDQTAANLSVPGDGGKATALTIPASVSGLSTTYLAKLVLTDGAGQEVSRNVYWLSTKPDTLNWGATTWWYTPTTASADLTGLSGMAQAPLAASATSAASGDTTTTTVTIRNSGTGATPALFVDAHMVDGSGKPVLPVQWSDNETSLWPGESTTLTATYRTADLHGSAPSVRVSGWNSATQTVPAGPGSPTNDFSVSVSPASGSVTAGGAASATVSTAVTSGSAQSVALTASGAPAGASVSFSPASVTAGGTSAMSVTTSSSTPAGSYPITITGTGASGTHTSTFTLTVGTVPTGGVTNGGFETGDFTGWTRSGTTSVTTSGAHGGTHAALLGSANPTNGDSKVSQTFTAPAGSGNVSFYYNLNCPDDVQYDWATATLKDNTAGTTATVLAKTCTVNQGWKQVTSAITPGHSYTLTLVSHDENSPGDATDTTYDDITVS